MRGGSGAGLWTVDWAPGDQPIADPPPSRDSTPIQPPSLARVDEHFQFRSPDNILLGNLGEDSQFEVRGRRLGVQGGALQHAGGPKRATIRLRGRRRSTRPCDNAFPETPSLDSPETPSPPFMPINRHRAPQGLSYDEKTGHFYAVEEVVEQGDDTLHPVTQELVVDERSRSYRVLERCPVHYSLSHANKGFEVGGAGSCSDAVCSLSLGSPGRFLAPPAAVRWD